MDMREGGLGYILGEVDPDRDTETRTNEDMKMQVREMETWDLEAGRQKIRALKPGREDVETQDRETWRR